RAVDLRKIGRLIAWRHLQDRIARYRAGDVDAFIEAGQPIGRGLRNRGPDRTAEGVGGDLDGGGGGEYPLLPAFGDAGLPRQQRGDILIPDLRRHQCEDAETNTEGRETRALRVVTQLEQ